MQSILFLRSTDEGPVDRIINIDLLATASPDPDNPSGTLAIVGYSQIKMGMSFETFKAKVEELIAENYRVSNESYVAWHNKRIMDAEESMKRAMKEVMDHHT